VGESIAGGGGLIGTAQQKVAGGVDADLTRDEDLAYLQRRNRIEPNPRNLHGVHEALFPGRRVRCGE
jgi:hypothetical protein